MPKMMNSYELKKLFLKQKAKLPLHQIRLYIKARRDFLKLKSNDSSEDSHKGFLNSYLETLEPDVFFDTYYSDYFGIAKPFSCLCSHFQEINKNDNKLQADLLSLFYFIFYITEAEFYNMYQKLLTILQKRSVYRYKLDKDLFIQRATAEIESQLLRKNDFIQFEITKAEVDFNDSRKMSMSNAQSQVEDSETHKVVYEPKPLFDLANVIMANTMLPRLAIIKMIKGLSAEARNKINNQDYLEEAIKTINKLLKVFKSKDFLTAELVEGVGALEKDIFEVDKIANEGEIKYLFTPNPSHRRAMNLKYKFDSEGELKFAKALDDDPNVLLYTKLKKGGFVLETPAGDYSPDWAIVYQKNEDNFAMYFIAETKWDKEAGGLSEDEVIKIKCATKHFEAINSNVSEVVKYAWVNSYKDTTKGQPFPQVFVDDRYNNNLPLERI